MTRRRHPQQDRDRSEATTAHARMIGMMAISERIADLSQGQVPNRSILLAQLVIE